MKKFDIPVLFVIYKRENTALQVLEAIAKIKPEKLYISQDGPKTSEEKKKIIKVRKKILSKISWNCKLTTWFHDKNLGLSRHTPLALDKFFKIEEYGIYLEDDTLPNEEFFYFQKELLEKYRDDKKVFSIGGTNFFPEISSQKYSYYISRLCSVWGMGLWRRSWMLYGSNREYETDNLKDRKIKDYFFNKKFRFYLYSYWEAIKKGFQTWDFHLYYVAALHHMYFITPSKNLVTNIGMNNGGTNPFLASYDTELGNILPLEHPKALVYRKDVDIAYFDKLLRGGWLRLYGIKLHLISPTWLRKIIEKLGIRYLRVFFK